MCSYQIYTSLCPIFLLALHTLFVYLICAYTQSLLKSAPCVLTRSAFLSVYMSSTPLLLSPLSFLNLRHFCFYLNCISCLAIVSTSHIFSSLICLLCLLT